jgi:hypothetical protein
MREESPRPGPALRRDARVQASVFGDPAVVDRVEWIVNDQAEIVGQLVVAVLNAKLGVQLQPTRYGGAVMLGIWQGDHLEKRYADSPEELSALCERVLGTLRAQVRGEVNEPLQFAKTSS